MSENFFCESLFTIQYILDNKIEAILLADIYVTKYSFTDRKFREEDCQILEIEP